MSSHLPWVKDCSGEEVRLDLIDALYSASTDPKRWPLFMDRVSHWFAGQAAMFVVDRANGPSVRFLGGNLDPERMRSHDDYYGGRCPWPARLGAGGSVVDVSERLYPVDELVRTEYYNDWLRPQGQHHWLGIHPDKGERTLHLGIGRAEKRGTFGGVEARFFLELAPHLTRAIDIARRLDLLDKQTGATAAVLDGLKAGVLLVGANGAIAYANAVAERLLSAGDGIAARNGRVRATAGSADPMLRAAIAGATSPGLDRAGATLSLPRAEADSPLSLLVSPLHERDRPLVGTGPLAMLLIGVPELDAGLSEEGLRAVYDLTPAEARLAAALCAGQSLTDHAHVTGISINTVKYHLKSIFGKTGDTRQPELIRRLLADPVLRLAN